MRGLALSAAIVGSSLVTRGAPAAEPEGNPKAISSDGTPSLTTAGANDAEAPELRSIQYGAGIALLTTVGDSALCPREATVPCIFGGGGGALVRVGFRWDTRFYVGGVYQLTRHDSSNLLVLPLLSELRAEGRYLFVRGSRFRPLVEATIGAAYYGSEFRADTWGGALGLSLGAEFEASRGLLLVPLIGYHPVLWAGYEDSAGQTRAGGPGGLGLSHLVGIQLTAELLSPRPRWER